MTNRFQKLRILQYNVYKLKKNDYNFAAREKNQELQYFNNTKIMTTSQKNTNV